MYSSVPDEELALGPAASSPPNHQRRQRSTAAVYKADDHVSILTRSHNSVLPKVIPYCFANIVLTYVVYFLREQKYIDVTFSTAGHSLMLPLISFLTVIRSSIAYNRFMVGYTNKGRVACAFDTIAISIV